MPHDFSRFHWPFLMISSAQQCWFKITINQGNYSALCCPMTEYWQVLEHLQIDAWGSMLGLVYIRNQHLQGLRLPWSQSSAPGNATSTLWRRNSPWGLCMKIFSDMCGNSVLVSCVTIVSTVLHSLLMHTDFQMCNSTWSKCHVIGTDNGLPLILIVM